MFRRFRTRISQPGPWVPCSPGSRWLRISAPPRPALRSGLGFSCFTSCRLARKSRRRLGRGRRHAAGLHGDRRARRHVRQRVARGITVPAQVFPRSLVTLLRRRVAAMGGTAPGIGGRGAAHSDGVDRYAAGDPHGACHAWPAGDDAVGSKAQSHRAVRLSQQEPQQLQNARPPPGCRCRPPCWWTPAARSCGRTNRTTIPGARTPA